MFVKKIIEFFKDLFTNKSIDFLEVGDLIIVKRYNNRRERKAMPEGHETGPAIVIKIDNNNIYYLSCSSRKLKNASTTYRPLISKNDYNELSKDTYVVTIGLKVLKPKNLIRKVNIIRSEDMDRIYKALFISREYYKNPLPKIEADIQYSVGDIVIHDFARYYIIDVENNKYHALKIFSNVSAKNKKKYYINKKPYAIDYSRQYAIDANSDIEFINSADKKTQSSIKNDYLFYLIQEKQRIEQEKQRIEQEISQDTIKEKSGTSIPLERGMLIDYENSFYYIYGKEKDIFLLYKVKPYADNQNEHKISINNKAYYTLFLESRINENEVVNTEVVDTATEKEIDKIKDQRKNAKKQNKKSHGGNVQIRKDIKPRCVIVDNNTNKEYLIIYRKGNTIRYAPLDDLSCFYELTLKHGQSLNFYISRFISYSEFRKIVDNHNYGNHARRWKGY